MNPRFLLALALLLVAAACSDDGSMLDSTPGNVHVVFTGEGGSTLAAVDAAALSAVVAGTPGTGQPSVLGGEGREDDSDEEPDGDGGDDDVLPQLEQANVTLASILARNLDGELIDLAVEMPQIINLVSLSEGGSVEMPPGTLPPGDYDQVVIVMTELELVFLDGSSVAITPAGGGWTQVLDVPPFTVADGETTTLELQFQLDGAIRMLGENLEFFPDIECRER
jgi:hypothetical protein